MKRYSSFKKAAVVLMFILIAVGCSDKTNETEEIDPPPYDLAALSERWENANSDDEVMKESTFKTTIYAQNKHGYLAPIKLDIPFVEKTATQTLAYMTKGGPVERLLPEGFDVLLPEGTEVIGMDIHEGTATIDFSEHFMNYNAHEERELLESIVWTLTEFSNIESVQIWIDGRPLKEMPVARLPTSGKLSRAMGINLEYADGVQLSQAMPVTLYFKNESDDSENAFVPVTRMIKKTDAIFEDIVQQLILGPSSKGALQPVMNSHAELTQAVESNGVVSLEFTESLYGDMDAISDMTLTSLTLSLLETTGVEEVHVQISGQ